LTDTSLYVYICVKDSGMANIKYIIAVQSAFTTSEIVILNL